jgi:transposase, IS5 family
VIDFEAYDSKPSDSELLISIDAHEQLTGRTPQLLAADAGLYSAKNEAKAKEFEIKRVSLPNRSTRSEERKGYQKQRWFKRRRGGEPGAKAESAF